MTVDCPIGTIKDLLAGDDSLVGKVLQNQTNQTTANHAADFDIPIYNVLLANTKSSAYLQLDSELMLLAFSEMVCRH